MENEGIIHNIDQKPNDKKTETTGFSPFVIVAIIVVAVVSAFGVSRFTKKANTPGGDIIRTAAKESMGQKNTKLFPDMAEGTVKKGGIDGEGTHHLVRKGGASQNVYMTSSVVDLDSLVGKKITVWGKTYAAQKAGWLMDVGYVEVR